MKYFYETNFLSGIYKIVNTHSGRFYIGQTNDFKRRWEKEHTKFLNKNSHSNKFLQNDFNKCLNELGHDDFLEFYVLETLSDSTEEQRLVIEQKHLDRFHDKQVLCYNSKKDVLASSRSCFSYTPEETAKRMSIHSKHLWQIADEETREIRLKNLENTPERLENLSILMNQTWANPEKRKARIESMNNPKATEANSRKLKALWQEGTEFRVKQEAFRQSEEFRENIAKNSEVAWANNPGRKKKQSDRNKERMNADPEMHKRMLELSAIKRAKHFEIISPDGTVYKESNAKKFLLEHNLNRGKFYELLRQERLDCDGWHLCENSYIAPSVEETRANRSEAGKLKWKDEEFRTKRTAQIIEQNKSEEMQNKKSESMKKTMADPGKRELKSKVFKDKMANDPDFDKQQRHNLSKGYEYQIKTYNITLVDPDGNQYTNIRNLSKFCREHGLENKNIHQLIRAKRKSCLGWRLLSPEQSSDTQEAASIIPPEPI